jgi:peptide/nickel transport system ATP-binding protein
MALMNNPVLLVMDEPTTALDVTTQAVVLDLVAGLKEQYDSAIFYITHDLAVVARICDHIGVMYAGELLESGPTRDLFKNPRHPYTLSLVGSIPKFEEGHRKRALAGIEGLIPSLRELPSGCVFSPRCFMADDGCRQKHPALSEIGPDRRSACLKWSEMEERRKVLPPPGVYPPPAEVSPRLVASDLVKLYRTGGGWRRTRTVKALNSVSLNVPRGYTLGIVGESGCGKTTLLRTITGLVEPDRGQVILDDEALPPGVHQRPRPLLKKIQMVFQNPAASLNPNQTVARSLERPLKIFTTLDKKERRAAILKILASVNLPANY